MKDYLKNVNIVLVEPKNPGNIGSSVRAMKNMGISNLRVVNPVDYREIPQQRKMGYRSQEIIKQSVEYPTLLEAVKDVSTVFLTTSRAGKWKRDFLTPEGAAAMIGQRIKKEKVAVVFGREDFGVTIDECQLANYCVCIPSAVSYPSLNLSQAVMVMVYEIYKQAGNPKDTSSSPKIAPKKDYERLYENIWDLMKALELREPDKGLFHRSLKRALNRTHWTNADIAVFDRWAKQVRWYVGKYLNKKFKGYS